MKMNDLHNTLSTQMFSNNAVFPLMIKNQQDQNQRGKKRHLGKVIHIWSFLFRAIISHHCQCTFKSSVINIHSAHQVYDRVITFGKNVPLDSLSTHSSLKLWRLERTLTKLNTFPKKKKNLHRALQFTKRTLSHLIIKSLLE